MPYPEPVPCTCLEGQNLALWSSIPPTDYLFSLQEMERYVKPWDIVSSIEKRVLDNENERNQPVLAEEPALGLCWRYTPIQISAYTDRHLTRFRSGTGA